MAETGFCPYVGLRPYEVGDRDYFFGREREVSAVVDHLFGARVTVFYGASGVGKSSVLMAGVLPALRKESRSAAVVFRGWSQPDAIAQLKRAVVDESERAAGRTLGLDATLPFDELLARAAEAIDGALLVLLDQFEEYFLYFPDPDAGFDTEVARAITRRDVDAGFLIALREDALSRLDRLKKRVPQLLSDTVRLQHLDSASAARAIREPVRVCAERNAAPGAPAAIEDALVEQVIAQTAPGRLSLSPSAAAARSGEVDEGRVEAPYLQLVMERLWAEEQRAKSPALRRRTLDDLGGAQAIVRAHLREVLDHLSAADQDLAARVFDRLVTPSGAKVAVRLKDLAAYAGDLAGALPALVKFLDRNRVLARIEAPAGQPADHDQYQILHDVMAVGVLAWRAAFVESRNVELAREAAKKAMDEQRSKEFRRRATVAIMALGAFSVGTGYLYLDADKARREAEAARREAEAARDTAAKAAAAERRAQWTVAVQQTAIDESTKNAPQVRAQIEKAVSTTSIVYVQYAGTEQRELAMRLQSALRGVKYEAPGVEAVDAAPAGTEVRYFRRDDEANAKLIAEQVRRWNLGPAEARWIAGYEARARLKQFEIWLARPDLAALRPLVAQLNAPEKADRWRALAALEVKGSASRALIAETLALFEPARIEALSAEGRFNALYFLARSAPLAWDAPLASQGRTVLALLEVRARSAAIGEGTRAEMTRLAGVLDAVQEGAPGPP